MKSRVLLITRRFFKNATIIEVGLALHTINVSGVIGMQWFLTLDNIVVTRLTRTHIGKVAVFAFSMWLENLFEATHDLFGLGHRLVRRREGVPTVRSGFASAHVVVNTACAALCGH